jgi:hypothetical protein
MTANIYCATLVAFSATFAGLARVLASVVGI